MKYLRVSRLAGVGRRSIPRSPRRWVGIRLAVPAFLVAAPFALLVGWGTPAGALTANPQSLDFGQVPLNTTVSQTVDVTIDAGYTGDSALDPALGWFSQTADTCNGFVGPGTCAVTIAFTPTARGTEYASIAVEEYQTTGGDASETVTIDLQGTAEAIVTATPTSVNFGQVPLNTMASQTITLNADSNFTPAVSVVTGGTPSPFGLTDNTCAKFVGPGNCTVDATYSPTTTSGDSGVLDVNEVVEGTLPTPGNEVTIPLTGTGVVTTVPVVVTGTQTYESSSPTFATSSSPPSGDTFSGSLECTSVGSPAQAITPSLTVAAYAINGSSCSGLSLSGPTAADYSVAYSGSTFTVSKAPTTLVAAPVSIVGSALSLKVTYSATLVISGTIKAVADQAVTFSDGPLASCTGTTNANGVATCTAPLGLLAMLLSPSYAASFGGDIDYLPSSGAGAVELL
jgi:hypothetical protein